MKAETNQVGVEARAIELLQSKSSESRQTAALILSQLGTPKAAKALQEAVDGEKADDVRDQLLEGLAAMLPTELNREEIEQKIAAAKKRGKLNKPIRPWLDESLLPPVKWLDGEALSLEAIRFILYRQNRSSDMAPELELRPVLKYIDKTTSGAFAAKVFELFQTKSLQAKDKFTLSLAGILGDDDLTSALKKQTLEWAQGSRNKMAENAVFALALIGTPKALRAVDEIARKCRNKPKNVGQAALASFDMAAREQGVSTFELADRIVPNFNFDGVYRDLEINGKNYRSFVDLNFKIVYLNEDGKKLSSLPKGASAELKAEMTEIGKEIREIVKNQHFRFETYMVVQRRWSTEAWRELFLTNPLLFPYALSLVWGVFDANGILIKTFITQDDLTQVDSDYEEIELPDDTQIGIVHAMNLTNEQKTAWQTYLSDGEIKPPFEQLNRPVNTPTENEKNVLLGTAFAEIAIPGSRLKSMCEKLGWTRGSVVDGGSISSFRKAFDAAGIEVFMILDGYLNVSYYDDYADDTKIEKFCFVKSGSVKTGSYMYDEPSRSDDPRLIPFKDVPAIVYSEVLGDLKRMAGKADEE